MTWSPVGDHELDPGTCKQQPDYSIDEACYAAAVTASGRYTIQGWYEQLQLGNYGVYDYLTFFDEYIGGVLTPVAQIAVGPDSCSQGGSPGYLINDNFGLEHVDWCLVDYNGQALPPPGTCPSGTQQDTQTGRCYTFQEQNAGSDCDCVGDPISAGSGNLYEAITDYTGTGPFPLTFKRSYNSGIANEGSSPDGADQTMGTGWTSNIEAHLYIYIQPEEYSVCTDPSTGAQYVCPSAPIVAPGSVTVWHADGSQAVFTGQFFVGGGAQGALTPAQGTTGQLISNGFSYEYIRNDGYAEFYDGTGKLTSVEDKYGAKQTYTYNYTINGGIGTLTSLVITDPNGRTMTISYTNGLITQVTDPAGNQYNYGYDTTVGDPGYGNLTSFTYAYNNPYAPIGSNGTRQVTYLYGDTAFPHALTGILDENESSNPSGPQYSSWQYDSQGRAFSSQHAGGQDKVTIAYNTDGSADVTEATGVVRHMTFQQVNGRFMLATVNKHCVSCGDDIASAGYDGNSHISGTIDFKGNQTTYQMDAGSGLQLSRTEAYGDSSSAPVTRTITTTWCGPVAINGNTCILPFVAVNTITEPGRTTQYSYTVSNNVISKVVKTVTDTATGATRVYTTTYDGVGHPTSVTGPRSSNVTNFAYYAQASAGNYNKGDLSSISTSGLTTKFSQYDADGNPTKILDPNNVERDITYDTRERAVLDVKAVSTSMQRADTYVYYPNGLLDTDWSNTGFGFTYAYDDAHRLTSVFDDQGRYLMYGYTLDSAGYHVDEYTYDCHNYTECPGGVTPLPGAGAPALHRQRIRSYDASHDQLQEIGGAGQATTYAYDANGNVQTVTTPGTSSVSVQKTYDYDALNRVESTVDNNSDHTGGTTTYVLDELDHTRAVTSPGGVTTSYTVDAFGETTEVQSPDSGTRLYDYTNWISSGQVAHTDAIGNVLTYEYDALNRLAAIVVNGNTGKNVTFTWDNTTSGYYGLGRLSTMQDSSGTTAFKYDPNGNTVEKDATILGRTFAVQYTYGDGMQAKDRLTSIKFPSITSGVNYTYNGTAAGAVTEVDGWRTSGGTTTTFPMASAITYEPFGPMMGFSYGNSLTETRQYDVDYRIANITVSGGVMNRTYAYYPDNTIQQITDNLVSGDTQTFIYDGLDRLTSAVQPGGYGTETYSYMNPTTHADMDGNRAQWVNRGSAYNYVYQGLNDGSSNPPSNRLASRTLGTSTVTWTYTANGEILSDGTYSYAYDRLRNLVDAKTAAGSTLAAYAYNGFNQRVEKTVGSTITQYVYDESGHPLAEINGSTGAVNVIYNWLGDRLLSFANGGSFDTTHVQYTHVDHLNAIRDISQANGTNGWTWNGDPFGRGAATVLSLNTGSKFELRSPGQYDDTETGLYYNNARFYNTNLGRYVQSDPIGLAGGLNTYTYVQDDPTNFTDLLGLYWQYSQSTGQISHVDNSTGNSTPVGNGYSGNGAGLNNGSMQNQPYVGPIPTGSYYILPPVDNPNTGSLSLPLEPEPGTNTYNRSGFFIHGDNPYMNNSASEGCIVTNRNVRQQISNSSDNELIVVP